MPPPWSVVYYQSDDGVVPFVDFIGRLKTQRARAECLALIEFLEKRGGTLDRDQTHLTHANGLREIQGQYVRIFYFREPDSRLIIVIDGLFPGQAGKLFDDLLRKAEDYAL
jgi:hypothetical protein